MGVELDPGSGGAEIATDTIAGEEFQLIKLVDGAEDSTARIGGDATNGLDVDVTRVQGTVAVTGPVTDTQLRATPVPVSGTVTASGPLTDTQLRATPVPVSGTVTASGPLTDTQLRATAVPVSLPGSLAGVADDGAFTIGTTPVLPAGFVADQSSTDSVNEGDVGAARMTLDRKQIVVEAPSIDTEGWDTFRTLDLDETEEDVKTSAGKLDGYYLYNDAAAEVYVHFYNAAAAAVTVGSTTPKLTLPVPAGSAANLRGLNLPFDTAICIAATTASDGTGNPATNQVVANIFYK